jgi:hypothetical protein
MLANRHYVMFVFFQLFLSYFNVCLSPAFVVLSVVKKRHSALVAGHTISIFIFSYQLYCIIFAMLVVAFPLAVPPLVFHAGV